MHNLAGSTSELLGTTISVDAPLMSSGLDSIGITELSSQMSERLDTTLPSTLLFDHPSLRSIAVSVLRDRAPSTTQELKFGSEDAKMPGPAPARP